MWSVPPAQVAFVIEVPRGGRFKRTADGAVDFVSPIACPFNYGSAPGYPAADGDPADVVVLGGQRARGDRGELPIVARVRFVDAGLPDEKWVCSDGPPSASDLHGIRRFFRFYALCKVALNALRRRGGPTRFEGLDLLTGP